MKRTTFKLGFVFSIRPKRSAICNRWFPGPMRVVDAIGISIASAVFAGLTRWQTDWQTNTTQVRPTADTAKIKRSWIVRIQLRCDAEAALTELRSRWFGNRMITQIPLQRDITQMLLQMHRSISSSCMSATRYTESEMEPGLNFWPVSAWPEQIRPSQWTFLNVSSRGLTTIRTLQPE